MFYLHMCSHIAPLPETKYVFFQSTWTSSVVHLSGAHDLLKLTASHLGHSRLADKKVVIPGEDDCCSDVIFIFFCHAFRFAIKY